MENEQVLFSEILPNLYMGGTGDFDIVQFGKQLPELHEREEFDSVVTCYSYAQPMSWYVHENRYGFADGPMDAETFVKVQELATWLHAEWRSGKKCLSRCQAGLNRSGLVVALVLMLEGYSADEAVALIREKRDPNALFNFHFVRKLQELQITQASHRGEVA
jgi:protein-tyrosine phosphatase